MELIDIENFITQLRVTAAALKGDGFGHIGHLKSAYKKICRQLEEFLEILKKAPPVENRVMNPNCFGAGTEDNVNVPNCECKKIFEGE